MQRICSDLIDEMLESCKDFYFGACTKIDKYGIKKFEFDINEEMSKKINKDVGHYITINCHNILLYGRTEMDYVAQNITDSLNKFFKKITKKNKPIIMVVGLGNGNIIADSLGVQVTQNLVASMQLPNELKKELGNLCYLNAGVGGCTGISSFDVVYSISNKIKPDIMLVIDALVANNYERLGCSFQLSNTGIIPGAGVGNKLHSIKAKDMKCAVIGIGVPMMIAGSSLCEQISNKLANKVFTPKDIDLYIDKCSSIIAKAINNAVHKNRDINKVKSII